MSTVDATFYAQVEPKFARRWSRQHNAQVQYVESAKVVAFTQSKPAKPKGGTVTVKLTLRFPEAAFLPLEPAAIIDIPASLTSANVISVEAVDPNDAGVADYLATQARAAVGGTSP